MASSLIPPETVRAYRETHYRVQGAMPCVLRIDECCPDLVELYRTHGVSSAAFITACNPFSQRLSIADNEGRRIALAEELQRLALPFLPGMGEHPNGQWPGEESYLVLGVTHDAAIQLGRQFEQNAIVWCGSDAVPRLILLR
jgi:hypothetical protein